MISPEILKRYAFFAPFDEKELQGIAMFAEETSLEEGTVLFEEHGEADTLYLLLDGGIDLYFKSEEEYHPKGSKEFYVGCINPGEICAISAIMEPHKLTATARVSKASQVVKIDAKELWSLLSQDAELGFSVLQQVIKVLYQRLTDTRVQLAACLV